MSRPRKSTEQTFYDVFADWPIADQAAALRIMTELHRQKSRAFNRRHEELNNRPDIPAPTELLDTRQSFTPAPEPGRLELTSDEVKQ